MVVRSEVDWLHKDKPLVQGGRSSAGSYVLMTLELLLMKGFPLYMPNED